jgi:hypothetical protein
MSAALAYEFEPGAAPPRIAVFPDRRLRSRGREAVEVAEACGLILDPWQRQVLVDGLRVRGGGTPQRPGRWAAFEVGVNVARQNGKSALLEARELAALFVFREPLIIHSAHMWDTSLEAFRRLLGLIEDGDLQGAITKVSRSHGEEGIELRSGQRVRYRTRSKGGGRGFSSGLLVFDECMFLSTFAHGALIPTLSAQRNSQVWYAGSAVDQEVHEHGLVFTRLRERAIDGGLKARRLAYFEWSLAYESPAEVPPDVLEERGAWATTNPAFGIRISEDAVEAEHDALDARTFAVERLGVGDYPDTSTTSDSPVDLEAFDELTERDSEAFDPVVFAFDVSPDRHASIAVAGRRADGLLHGEVVDSKPGTRWLTGRLLDLVERHEAEAVVADSLGPAASVVADIADEGVRVEEVNATDHAEACSAFVDLVSDRAFRHRGEYEVQQALRGARTRPLGDRWAWSRKASSTDISPLVALTLALARARRLPEADHEVNIW